MAEAAQQLARPYVSPLRFRQIASWDGTLVGLEADQGTVWCWQPKDPVASPDGPREYAWFPLPMARGETRGVGHA